MSNDSDVVSPITVIDAHYWRPPKVLDAAQWAAAYLLFFVCFVVMVGVATRGWCHAKRITPRTTADDRLRTRYASYRVWTFVTAALAVGSLAARDLLVIIEHDDEDADHPVQFLLIRLTLVVVGVHIMLRAWLLRDRAETRAAGVERVALLAEAGRLERSDGGGRRSRSRSRGRSSRRETAQADDADAPSNLTALRFNCCVRGTAHADKWHLRVLVVLWFCTLVGLTVTTVLVALHPWKQHDHDVYDAYLVALAVWASLATYTRVFFLLRSFGRCGATDVPTDPEWRICRHVTDLAQLVSVQLLGFECYAHFSSAVHDTAMAISDDVLSHKMIRMIGWLEVFYFAAAITSFYLFERLDRPPASSAEAPSKPRPSPGKVQMTEKEERKYVVATPDRVSVTVRP